MGDIRELLRTADGGPASPPDHEAIRRRGRRLMAGRVAGVAAGVVALAVLGGVALQTLAGESPGRAPVVGQPGDQGEAEQPSDDDGHGESSDASEDWVNQAAMEAQEGSGQAIWVVGYFYPSDEDMAGPGFADQLEPRWKRVRDETADLDRDEQLRRALGELPGPAPAGMSNAWQDPSLELELGAVELDGAEVVLDFEQLQAPAAGSAQAMAMQAQFEQAVFHYYPEAEAICVLDDGQPAIWLHDMAACPSR